VIVSFPSPSCGLPRYGGPARGPPVEKTPAVCFFTLLPSGECSVQSRWMLFCLSPSRFLPGYKRRRPHVLGAPPPSHPHPQGKGFLVRPGREMTDVSTPLTETAPPFSFTGGKAPIRFLMPFFAGKISFSPKQTVFFSLRIQVPSH